MAQQKRIFRAAMSASAPHWLQLELSMAQTKALFALTNSEPATVSGLAAQLGVSLPDASRLVERLVQMEFVDRSEDATDRRRAVIRLTGRGNDLVLRLREGRERFDSWLARLSDEELAALAVGLEALARAATEND